MSDFEAKNPVINDAESVDDILAAILNPDGSFNDEFNGLLKKYVGGDSEGTVLPVVDISDRRDETPVVFTRVEYEEQEEISFEAPVKDVNERIEEKIPEEMRTVFAQASAEAQRPEFTSTGDVRYPTMGVGAAEERVVFDADWEETAKKEAARLERVRRDRMLRGDSAYARSFDSPAAYMPGRMYYVDNSAPASEYIDPLSRDSDFEGAREGSQYYSSSRKTFFPEGFSVTQKNNMASGGKTERMRSGSTAYMRGNAPVSSDKSWLQVEEKPAKKKMGLFSKKKKSETAVSRQSAIREDYEDILPDIIREAPEVENVQEEGTVRVNALPFDAEEISSVEQETEGLRSTVAEIVDKYNKRSEEDERKRLAEQVRLEEERREKELKERRRLEEIRVIKEQMSPEVVEAVESADAEDSFDEYEDFSTEPVNAPAVQEKKEKNTATEKAFGVVFDPSVFENESDIVAQLIEKISDTEAAEKENGEEKEAETKGIPSDRKKKKSRASRRKDS